MSQAEWRIRRFEPTDSFEELTELLHRSYAPLAERGFRYLATHQSVETTRKRASKGECFVAVTADDTVIGTIVVYPPASDLDHGNISGAEGPETYRQPGVATFGQYCVGPAWKGRGIGRALHAHAEVRARTLGATAIACDTAEPATELVEMYQRWGYTIVERMRWEVTSYESVVLIKPLPPETAGVVARIEETA